ncbi:MAG: hypothetical protein LBV43_15750 [Prevotella sp.]|jgi:hypothetical protein|nr:hypothetical protein [Prevotella sp.]
MNAVFSADRFWKLEKRNLSLSRMQYIYILGGLTGLYLLSMLLNVLVETSLSGLVFFAASVIVVCGPCFFENSINKHRSVFDFILPVSTFEKFLSFWLKYVIIIPLSILLLFVLLNLITSAIPVEGIKEHAKAMALSEHFFTYKIPQLIIVTQAVYMAGYFYFRKYAFGKTSLILVVLFVLFVVALIVMMATMFGGGDNELTMSLSSDSMEENSVYYNKGYSAGRTLGAADLLADPVVRVADSIGDIVATIGLWIVCFFKLRETEI